MCIQDQVVHSFLSPRVTNAFRYGSGSLSTTTLAAGDSLFLDLFAENVSDSPANEVVEIYLLPISLVGGPRRSLVYSSEIHLAPRSTELLKICIDARQLSYERHGGRTILAGLYQLSVYGAGHALDSGAVLSFLITGQLRLR